MRWYYKLIENTPMYYKYAYSRESKEYDGIIIYYKRTEQIVLEQACSIDKDSDSGKEAACDHFWRVVQDNFPDERSVCCG